MAEDAPEMDLPVTLAISPDAATALARILGIDPGGAPVDAVKGELAAVSRAALAEYILYFTGERVPAGLRDLRELRLRLLAEHLPRGLPTDAQVAQLFHLTSAQARNLIAGARARYPSELDKPMGQAAIEALRDATGGDDEDTVRITASDSLAAYLREIVSSFSSAQVPKKRSDASNRYDVTRSAVKVLCARLGIDVSEVKGLPAK